MDASQAMLDRVKSARAEADRADRAYDSAAELIQIKSERTIDLFSDSAASRVVEIASDARNAADELYATYQTLIQMLDAELRPLLAEGPSTRAVKEVYELIRYLNSESQISTNFSGSFNGSSFGNFASATYQPTIECRMIEKFWEQSYHAMEGWQEEDRAYRERQAAERKAKLEAERSAREAMLEYERQERERKKREAEEAEVRRQQDEARMAGRIAAMRQLARWVSRRVAVEYGGFETSFAAVDADGQVHVLSDRLDEAAKARAASWRNVEKVLVNYEAVYGLTADGLVVVAGKGSMHNELACAGWTGLKDLVLGDYTSLGLTQDGRVLATGESRRAHPNSTVAAPFTWTDVDALWAEGSDEIIARKRDGSLVTVHYNYYTRSDAGPGVPKERVVMATTSSSGCGAYLLANGRVSTFGHGAIDADNLAQKAGIIHLCMLGSHVLAVYMDGTVDLAQARDDDVYNRRIRNFLKRYGLNGRVLTVVGDRDHAAFVTTDGEVYQYINRTLSKLSEGKVEGLRLFTSLEEAQDRAENPEKYRRLAWEREQALIAERRAAGVCSACGGPFKKMLFVSACSACGRRKDY